MSLPVNAPMLLMCQSPALGYGSQPFLRCTVMSDGAPADTPHRSDGITLAMSHSTYWREDLLSTLRFVASTPSSVNSSRAVIWVRPHAWLSMVCCMPALSRNACMSLIPTSFHSDVAALLFDCVIIR